MNFLGELPRIVEYQNSLLPKQDKKSKSCLDRIVHEISTAYQNSTYDFKRYISITLRQDEKRRHIKAYPSFSCEDALCIFLKKLLDKSFNVKYPNRNSFMCALFDILNSTKNMNDYTIFRFDFQDFFNTVSSQYVYKKYIQDHLLERDKRDLLSKFVEKVNYTFAGISTSNILCEIICRHFDVALEQRLNNCGVIYYRRYIDDGIIIFNRYISRDKCINYLEDTIREVFYDATINCSPKCKTQLNPLKNKHISKRDLDRLGTIQDFDFLGYQFDLQSSSNKKSTVFQFGISQKKINKYSRRMDSLIHAYKKNLVDIELLRHQIKAFTSRTVYVIPKYKTTIWKNKGFIANYRELRYRLDLLNQNTKHFLEHGVEEAFTRNAVDLPYFMKAAPIESAYSLYNNLKVYRTLLLVENIGINHDTLIKMCTQVGINTSKKMHYDNYVKEYLIKVKVGHYLIK